MENHNSNSASPFRAHAANPIAPPTAPFDYIRADLLNVSRALTEEERVREHMRATIADLRTRLDVTTKAHMRALDEGENMRAHLQANVIGLRSRLAEAMAERDAALDEAARITVEMNRALEDAAMTRNRLERLTAANAEQDIDAVALTYEDGFCAGYDQGNIDTLRDLAEAGSDRRHRAFVGLWTLGIIGATLALPLAAFIAH